MATSSVVKEIHRIEMQRPCDQWSEQVGLGVTMTVPAGGTIVIEGDPINHYYRMVSGTVRLYKAVTDGRRQIIDFLGAKECFGLTGLAAHAYSAEAITDVVMIRYPKQRLEAAIDGQPEIGRQLFHLACTELDQAQRRMLLLGRKNADERLASFLLDLKDRQLGDTIQLSMSRQDIADYLGLTIETVSRLFTRFKRGGLIGLPDRHSVVLKRQEQLRALADGSLAS